MLAQVMELADAAVAAPTPEEASTRFFAAAERLGATYLQTRLYRRPATRLTSRAHWAAGGFVKRISPSGWPGSDAFKYVCFECNPLLNAIRESRTRYRFSDFAPHGNREYGRYWDALGEAKIADALCSTSYGPNRTITSLHLGFGRRDITPQDARTIQAAGLLLTERLIDFAVPLEDELPPLSSRERDSLAFAADGKTTWEISVILGVSEATVRFHLDNARRKLGAVNRTHAVARMINLRMI